MENSNPYNILPMADYGDIATTATVINAGIPENHTGCEQCKAHITAIPKRGPGGKGWLVLFDIAHTDERCPRMELNRGELHPARPWNLRNMWTRNRRHWTETTVVNRVRTALDESLDEFLDTAGAGDTGVHVSFEALHRLREDLTEIAVLADEALNPYRPSEDIDWEEAPF